MRYLLAIVLLSAGLSCGDDEKKECEAIIEACHEKDTGSGEIHECHENAESTWSKDQCVSNSARCLSLCKAGDAGS